MQLTPKSVILNYVISLKLTNPKVKENINETYNFPQSRTRSIVESQP